MADIVLRQDGQLPIATQVRYKDMGDDTHALVMSASCEGEDIDGNPTSPRIDLDSGGQIVMSHYEADVHQGARFKASYLQPHGSELANDAAHDFLIRVQALVPHISLEISAGGNCDLLFYEAPTISAAGALMDPISKNRSTVGAASTVIHNTPTITLVGTLLLSQFVPGGMRAQAGGGDWGGTEWILRANTDYLVRITNRSGGAIQLSLGLDWSES